MPVLLNSQGAKDFGLLVLGAFFYTIAFSPYEWTCAAWAALAPLFLVLRGKGAKAGFVAGLVYGVLACIGVTYWVYFTIAAYFPLVFPLDALCTLLSYVVFGGLAMGVVAALSCQLLRRFASSRGRVIFCWGAIPALWVSGEFVRSSLGVGFSWGILGYSQYRHPFLIQIADVTGVYGLSFLIVLSSYVLAAGVAAFCSARLSSSPLHSSLPCPKSAVIVLAVSLTSTLLYGALRLRHYSSPPSEPPLQIVVVRDNVPNEQRWRRLYYAQTLSRYLSLTRQGVAETAPDLVVWPEFAVDFYLDREPSLRAQLNWLTYELQTFLLVCAPRVKEIAGKKHFYNSAYLINGRGRTVDVYDKIHLVPFAEHSPFAFPAFLPHTLDFPSQFTAGARSTIFTLPRGSLGALICFEATYPSLARRLVRGGAQFLVNISNDHWLNSGGAAAARQHFALAVFRAVENRRFLVRAATHGVSGFVDPTGRRVQFSIASEGAMMEQVTPHHAMTLCTQYGDWFVYVCTEYTLIAMLLRPAPRIGAKEQP